jgi:uncharacterized membrane protein YfcA
VNERTRRWIGAAAGFATGAAAGLLGVGGGEFRIPVLLRVLSLPVQSASAANLIIGLCTVTLSAARRVGRLTWTREDAILVAWMAVASLAGSAFGVIWRAHVSHRPLLRIVRGYLILVGLWMLYESVSHTEHVLFDPEGVSRVVLAVLVAGLIAVASAMIGVAGGEMRIPALMYLFAVPITTAGTLSLLASIPTVGAGAITDWRLGQLRRDVWIAVGLLAVPSILGVLVGAYFVPLIDRRILTGIFGAVLLASSFRLMPHHQMDPSGLQKQLDHYQSSKPLDRQ